MSDDRDDFDLDRLLTRAAAAPAAPSDALMERVLADALALQPKPHAASAPAPAAARPAVPPPRRGFWEALTEAFGGRGVLAGLGAAAVLGLYVGYVDPGGLMADRLMPTETGGLELMPAAELFLTGG
ncbi:MAG: hypothetical protein IAE87_01600 [Rhodobacteraceae bacterium]|jgi:hypothetical protein|nr:hypothetical protein [Paracoccaceae bacterium]